MYAIRSYYAERVAIALEMVENGATIIDVGGESTRPGAEFVSLAEELERVVPVVEALRRESNVAISLDTNKAAVAEAGLEAGADIINDITALRGTGDMAAVAVNRITSYNVCYTKLLRNGNEGRY